MNQINLAGWCLFILIAISTIYILFILSDSPSDLPTNSINTLSYLNYTIDYSDCPKNFVIPGCEVEMYKYLSELGSPTNCDARNCSNCLPPNTPHKRVNEIHTMWSEAYQNTKTQRQSDLSQLLQSHQLYPGGNEPVILMVLNYGFSYIFSNFACSLDYNQLSFIKKRTIVIPSDSRAKELVQKAGFELIFEPKWLPPNLQSEFKQESTYYFGPGFYPMLMLQMITLSDLMDLGYDTLMMDSDVIWKRNVLDYFANIAHPIIDIWTMLAPRWDIKGFGNTGTILMRSNCKTKTFMNTMMEYISFIYKRGDQGAFNFFLNWKPFRQVIFKLLDQRLFVGGNDVKEDFIKENGGFYMIHAFSVADHFDKIWKFNLVGEWYFSQEKCPHLFNESLLPHIEDRDEKLRDGHTSDYLIERNLVRHN